MSGPWKRREVIGDCILYLGRCEDILPSLGRVDLVLTDPPYGIGEARNDNASRSCLAQSVDYGCSEWDDDPATPEQISIIRACSRHQIIFGGNYFDLPPASCWLVWDKQNGDNDFADCELAWTNLPKAVRRIYWRWHGMIRRGREERFHPTQKPLGVMEWALQHVPDAKTIADPFMGSGTTLVACARFGKRGVGIEKDEGYFDIACRRIEEAYRQPDFFVERPAPAEQLALSMEPDDA